MSGTGEYGISAPNRHYYRLIESEDDAKYEMARLTEMFVPYIHPNLNWNPVPIKRNSRARTWGLAQYPNKISLYSPMFGVLVHEITHLINFRRGERDSHGESFKDLLQHHWNIILDDENYIKHIQKYRHHPIYYFNRVQRLCKNAGFEFDVFDDVAVTKYENGEVIGMFVAEVLSFISEDKVWVRNKQNCFGSRYTEGKIYSVNISQLDLPDTYYDKPININDLEPEVLQSLLKDMAKNA